MVCDSQPMAELTTFPAPLCKSIFFLFCEIVVESAAGVIYSRYCGYDAKKCCYLDKTNWADIVVNVIVLM